MPSSSRATLPRRAATTDADAATTDALTALVCGTTGQDWWERGGDVVRLAGFDLYLGLESVATCLSLNPLELVHGLFQAEEYARAVQRSSLIDPNEADVERTVRTRLARQDMLFVRPTPPRIEAVLSEGALTRPVGSAGVIAEQRARLLELVDRDGSEIDVLPAEAGPHPGFSADFRTRGLCDANSIGCEYAMVCEASGVGLRNMPLTWAVG